MWYQWQGVMDSLFEFDSAAQKWLMTTVAGRCDNAGILRYSQAELAAVTLLSPRTVARELERLQDKGFVQKIGQARYKVLSGSQPAQGKGKDRIPAVIKSPVDKEALKQRLEAFIVGNHNKWPPGILGEREIVLTPAEVAGEKLPAILEEAKRAGWLTEPEADRTLTEDGTSLFSMTVCYTPEQWDLWREEQKQ